MSNVVEQAKAWFEKLASEGVIVLTVTIIGNYRLAYGARYCHDLRSDCHGDDHKLEGHGFCISGKHGERYLVSPTSDYKDTLASILDTLTLWEQPELTVKETPHE